MVKYREARHAVVLGVANSWTNLVTEQQVSEMEDLDKPCLNFRPTVRLLLFLFSHPVMFDTL